MTTPACAAPGIDPETFHEPSQVGNSGSHNDRDRLWADRQRQAKAICAGCALREPCLMLALEGREAGIWGGTTEEERARMRRNRRIARRKASQ